MGVQVIRGLKRSKEATVTENKYERGYCFSENNSAACTVANG